MISSTESSCHPVILSFSHIDEPDLMTEGTGKEWEKLRAVVARLRRKIGDSRKETH